MAQLTQNDAASKKAALEQLARKREFLQEQSDGLKYELGLKIDRILQVERVIEERRPEWESWPELHDDLVRGGGRGKTGGGRRERAEAPDRR